MGQTITLNGVMTEEMRYFKHLGSSFSSDGRVKEDLRMRVSNKKILFGGVYDLSAPPFRRGCFGATVSAPGRFGADTIRRRLVC